MVICAFLQHFMAAPEVSLSRLVFLQVLTPGCLLLPERCPPRKGQDMATDDSADAEAATGCSVSTVASPARVLGIPSAAVYYYG